MWTGLVVVGVYVSAGFADCAEDVDCPIGNAVVNVGVDEVYCFGFRGSPLDVEMQSCASIEVLRYVLAVDFDFVEDVPFIGLDRVEVAVVAVTRSPEAIFFVPFGVFDT